MQVHYVYQIENLVNNKIYIGKHSTSNMDDGYMGSGKLLIKAIKKDGIENFKKTILCFFETEDQVGNKNSNYGNVWIHNIDLKKSIRIPRQELQNYLDTGWTKGRKISWKN